MCGANLHCKDHGEITLNSSNSGTLIESTYPHTLTQSWDSTKMKDQLYANACASYYTDSEVVANCAHRMYFIMRLFMWLVGLFGKHLHNV